MAVPDWPTTYGYNMFAYPLQTWLFGPFDLLPSTAIAACSIAGLLTIGLVFCAFRYDHRGWFSAGGASWYGCEYCSGSAGWTACAY